MASRILLISANQCRDPDPVFPLGLSYLHGALRRAGHECRWLDLLLEAERIPETLKAWPPDFVGISLRNIDDVLIRKRETFFGAVASLVSTVRQTVGCPVILGGSGFSIFPNALLERTQAEFGIVGEGEASLVSLIAALESEAACAHIPGLVFRQNGKIIQNGAEPTPLDNDLASDTRPQPITDFYLSRTGMLNVQTQRGCALHCCYCTYPLIEGHRHRRRPSEAVAAEFEEIQRLGARYVFIVDSVFNSSPGHVAAICEALLKKNLKLPWGCFLRPQGLSSELVRLMKRAGLTHIEFGTDSLCDDVLAAYQKEFTFADVVRSSDLARQEQIDFCHFLIAGGPGETQETLEEGFGNSHHLKNSTIMAVVGMRIYPGTNLFERAVNEGVITRTADLLNPAYYVAPGLSPDAIFRRLKEFSSRSPNWIVGDADPAYLRVVARLRERGIVGPLWSYFSAIQRLGLGAMAAPHRPGDGSG